jgi:hypothetical protein
MARQKSQKGQGGQTAVISVRLTPKLRYLTELAARKTRRSVSNFIEWAVAESLKQVVLREQPEITVASRSGYLWNVHEADRFVRLAHEYPDLLTHGEQILWGVIRSSRFLWRESEGPDAALLHADYLPPDGYFVFERLREHWDAFKAVARGEAEPATLPGMSSDEPER